MKRAYLFPVLVLLTACADSPDVEGERVSVGANGVVHVCGENDGLPECRDENGETYGEELKVKPPTDEQMETEAAKVRAETPGELEKTISDLEQNPELIDTMAE